MKPQTIAPKIIPSEMTKICRMVIIKIIWEAKVIDKKRDHRQDRMRNQKTAGPNMI